MDEWLFTHPDCWTRPATSPVEWGDDEEMHAFMARLGYRFQDQARNADLVEFLGAWSLWASPSEGAAPAYALLLWGAGERFTLVWLPTFPDVMAYMAKYGEVGQRFWEREEWDDVANAVTLWFRASHGHGVEAVCARCDPERHARWRKERAATAARKAAQYGATPN